jgi:hypothetical protein
MKDPVQVIIDRLAPVIGEHMAKSAVTGSVERLGARRDQLSTEQLAQLLHGLGLGLNVFVGRAAGQKLILELGDKLGVTPRAK